MSTDHRSTTLSDVNPSRTRTLQVTPHPYFTPDNAIIAAIYRDRTTGEESYYPVEVKRKDLFAALGAEPDETDYQEVVAENLRLGRKLAKAISDRDAARVERDAARFRASEEPEAAPEEPREDQGQIDRSWALEKAGEVLGRLAAVGALPKDWAGVPVIAVAEWILNGEPVDRG